MNKIRKFNNLHVPEHTQDDDINMCCLSAVYRRSCYNQPYTCSECAIQAVGCQRKKI